MISRGQGFSYPFLLHYWFHLVLNKKLKNNIRNRILLNAKGLILKANGLNSNMLSTFNISIRNVFTIFHKKMKRNSFGPSSFLLFVILL